MILYDPSSSVHYKTNPTSICQSRVNPKMVNFGICRRTLWIFCSLSASTRFQSKEHQSETGCLAKKPAQLSRRSFLPMGPALAMAAKSTDGPFPSKNDEGSLPAKSGCSSAGTGGESSCSSRLQTDTESELETSCAARNQDTNEVIPDKQNSKNNGDLSGYHLLWSPGVIQKMAMTTAALLLGGQLLATSDLSIAFAPWLNRLRPFGLNLLLPTLASACCWMQLALNMISVGCAGFNTYLGPIRPFFLSILISWTFVTAPQIATVPAWAAWSRSWFFRWVVALMPEALHLWNTRPRDASIDIQASSESSLNKSMDSSLPSLQARLELEIPSMGCVACINKIEKAIRQKDLQENEGSSPVQYKHVSSGLLPLGMKGGQATVVLEGQSRKHIKDDVDRILDRIAEAGFPERIISKLEIDSISA